MDAENKLVVDKPPMDEVGVLQVSLKISSPVTKKEEVEEINFVVPSKLSYRILRNMDKSFWENKIKEAESLNLVGCLKNHVLNEEHRSAMVDWMIEVTKTYRCNERTLFIAIMIMDKYYKDSKVYII